MKPPLWLLLGLLCGTAGSARAQVPGSPIRLAIGFGVDTARSPDREILALYRHYLLHRLDSIRPHPDWAGMNSPTSCSSRSSSEGVPRGW